MESIIEEASKVARHRGASEISERDLALVLGESFAVVACSSVGKTRGRILFMTSSFLVSRSKTIRARSQHRNGGAAGVARSDAERHHATAAASSAAATARQEEIDLCPTNASQRPML